MTFKQLLQAEAIDVCQIDSCRLGGVSEVLAVLLMSAKFGIPVCPHAGGVGLCEYVVSIKLDSIMRDCKLILAFRLVRSISL
jgi:L-fuconate dehydratase